jgi:hypothetical protein
MCARDPLEVKGKGIRGVGGVADKETCTVHTINIISQRQCFVTRCLISCVCNVFGLYSICVFLCTRKLVMEAKRTDSPRLQYVVWIDTDTKGELRFEVLAAVSMKMTVFWVVVPCSLAMIVLIMEAASTSETSVNFYQTTRRINPEDKTSSP